MTKAISTVSIEIEHDSADNPIVALQEMLDFAKDKGLYRDCMIRDTDLTDYRETISRADRHEAVQILRFAAERLYDLGVCAEVDNYGQLIIFPPDGYNFTLDEDTNGLMLEEE